jgi:hypothetical protein
MSKRGRKKLSPEERLRRQRDRWLRKAVKKRKETADSKWLRATNYGYFERSVEVLHWDQFVDYLVHSGFLKEKNRDIGERIEEAADALLLAYVEERAECYGYFSRYHSSGGANPNFRNRSTGGNKLSIKITLGLVEALGLEDQCDNRRAIKKAVEELLFRIYSHIADTTILDPWRKTGPYEQWPRAQYRFGGMWNGNGLMEGIRARSYRDKE